MTIAIDESAVHDAWARGAAQVRPELEVTAADRSRAHRADVGDLQDRMEAALDTMAGVTRTALRLLVEHDENLDACLAAYRASDGTSSGTFRALQGPA